MKNPISNIKACKNRQVQSVLWIVFYLALIDIALNIIFRFPEDPQKTPPSSYQGYFEFGRSVEGKFDRMIRAATKPALGYSWFQITSDELLELLPKRAGKNQTLVAVYGMSHAYRLSEAITQVDSKYIVRHIMAPGAPPNWSFAAYEADKNKHKAEVVILGIMTDSISYVSATSGATSYFEASYPFTFPRYFVEDGLLKKIYPPFFTEEGFIEYLYNPKKWTEYTDWLAKNDKYYDTFLFKRSLTDRSALFRVLRFGYSEKIKNKLISCVYTKDGFNLNSEEIIALYGIVKAFAQSVRDQKSLPIIYIVNNQGRGDHLYRALKPVLDANNIPFLSTHIICPPDDPRVFCDANQHFPRSKDLELARQAIKIIEIEQGKSK